MSDLRSLMKSARRLEHPQAKYDRTGKLTCSLCALPVKHESLWAAHTTSKLHRGNAQRAQEALQKRALEEEDDDGGVESDEEPAPKRARKASEPAPEVQGLPAGFFDDASDAQAAAAQDLHPAASTRAEEQEAPVEEEEEEDPEWAAFKQTIAAPEDELAGYSNAAMTVRGEPVMFDAPAARADETQDGGDDDDDGDGKPEESEAERKDREEREELMERIENEEREQLEADERVEALKKRMALLKSARLAKAKVTT
ncbi:uncharacterized protein L969DRAFT_48204 [Mixia osmundae IAM 14324]|uniref:Coiled-coil domain-containing protein 16 n=1 Tax=Mixia osmundae (strain CBS 9802 / IAM 14324 / JCM 22182 / KY 12970) TaxID=764103 RepID=G7E8N4_MIXOS|nr:uncharacterized protein L969DRAFT_48204 [Mixia osmundae IAM 14324]KEI40136.1 hypothetical protein L969DRAFT_48204 [Mixia osmundae IAM 14324]GAA99502.1 hypothetical protein E5Q_06202 [Mixia osmundae IAM 14324]